MLNNATLEDENGMIMDKERLLAMIRNDWWWWGFFSVGLSLVVVGLSGIGWVCFCVQSPFVTIINSGIDTLVVWVWFVCIIGWIHCNSTVVQMGWKLSCRNVFRLDVLWCKVVRVAWLGVGMMPKRGHITKRWRRGRHTSSWVVGRLFCLAVYMCHTLCLYSIVL